MKKFIDICYLGWKPPWKNRALFTLIFLSQLCERGENCLLSWPTWVTASLLKYRELNEGCKCLIQITSTEWSTTQSAKNTRTWMKMDCWEGERVMLSVLGATPQCWLFPAAGVTCVLPAWPKDPGRKFDLTWHVIGTKLQPRMCSTRERAFITRTIREECSRTFCARTYKMNR